MRWTWCLIQLTFSMPGALFFVFYSTYPPSLLLLLLPLLFYSSEPQTHRSCNSHSSSRSSQLCPEWSGGSGRASNMNKYAFKCRKIWSIFTVQPSLTLKRLHSCSIHHAWLFLLHMLLKTTQNKMCSVFYFLFLPKHENSRWKCQLTWAFCTSFLKISHFLVVCLAISS